MENKNVAVSFYNKKSKRAFMSLSDSERNEIIEDTYEKFYNCYKIDLMISQSHNRLNKDKNTRYFIITFFIKIESNIINLIFKDFHEFNNDNDYCNSILQSKQTDNFLKYKDGKCIEYMV